MYRDEIRKEKVQKNSGNDVTENKDEIDLAALVAVKDTKVVRTPSNHNSSKKTN